MTQRFSSENGIVDERGRPVVPESAPVETDAEKAALDRQVDEIFPGEQFTEQTEGTAPKFGRPPNTP